MGHGKTATCDLHGATSAGEGSRWHSGTRVLGWFSPPASRRDRAVLQTSRSSSSRLAKPTRSRAAMGRPRRRPEDPLQARLRHRYREAKIHILRPFLFYTLHKDCPLDKQSDASIENEREINPSNHIFAAIDSMSRTSGDQELQCLTQLCLEAVKQSLRVYDGISGRLTVSNVQSTAHCRFENVLMLVAAYQNGYFPSIVTTKETQQELGKTTGFLTQLSLISPTAAADCTILEGIRRAVFSAP